MRDEQLDRLIKSCFVIFIFICFMQGLQVFADTSSISIGGKDNSSEMTYLQNLLQTLQTIGFKWVAKAIGGFLVITGVYKIASRDFMNGILATGGGGTLFFVEKIADSLSKMSGAS